MVLFSLTSNKYKFIEFNGGFHDLDVKCNTIEVRLSLGISYHMAIYAYTNLRVVNCCTGHCPGHDFKLYLTN